MFFFFGELNRNGWPVAVQTPVEEPICRTPKPLPLCSVFFVPAFLFIGFFFEFFFFSSDFVVTVVGATAEGPALRALGYGPAAELGDTNFWYRLIPGLDRGVDVDRETELGVTVDRANTKCDVIYLGRNDNCDRFSEVNAAASRLHQ